jgi:hypothetical protein
MQIGRCGPCKHVGGRGHITVTQKEENSLPELEARQKLIPLVPNATSYGMGWKGLQAVRYRTMSDTVEYSLPSQSGRRKSFTCGVRE